MANKQLLKHQHSIQAGFKIPVPNAPINVETKTTHHPNLSTKASALSTDGTEAEKTIIEIRRPLSYPESNNMQVSAEVVQILKK